MDGVNFHAKNRSNFLFYVKSSVNITKVEPFKSGSNKARDHEAKSENRHQKGLVKTPFFFSPYFSNKILKFSKILI